VKLSKGLKETLLNEIEIVREKMNQEKDPRKKTFYYSALYAIVERLYNLEYNPHLIFMHMIFNISYSTMNARINAIASGDVIVPLPNDFFDNLDKLLERIFLNIKNDEDTYLALEKISNLVYLLSGNGYYLSQKGVKVFSL